jgi:hypothetical protein
MKHLKNPKIVRTAAIAMIVVLFGLGAFYVRSGIRHLMAWDPGAQLIPLEKKWSPTPPVGNDLMSRWMDEQYIFRGQNPYDIYFAGLDPDGPEAYARSVHRNCTLDQELGQPWTVGYPPWSFVAGAALYGPPWPVTRYLSIVISLLSLALIGYWAYRLGDGGVVGLLFAAASLACNGYAGAFSIGQSTILVLAMLIVALVLAERGHLWACGIVIGLAMMKHTIAGPFLLCFLVRGQWKPIVSCLAYLILASIVVWYFTATDPVEMSIQMVRSAQTWAGKGSGPINLLIDAGFDPRKTMLGMAAGSVILATPLMWVLRRAPLLTLFTVAAVCCRVWTYHRAYDDAIMVFVLIAIGTQAARTHSSLDWALFMLTSVTLWLSPRRMDPQLFNAGQLVVWIAALGRIVAYHLTSPASQPVSATERLGWPDAPGTRA